MSIATIERYVRDCDRSRYAVFAQQGNEPTDATVRAFEAECGGALPADFREFALHPLGGLYVEAREEVWPSPKPFDVGPFWSFLRGVMVYSLSPEAPGWLSLPTAWREMRDVGTSKLIPFMKVIGDSDPYCFGADGRIFIWRHEEPDSPEPVDGGFYDVLLGQLQELEHRTERMMQQEK